MMTFKKPAFQKSVLLLTVAAFYCALLATVAFRHYGGNISGFLYIGKGIAADPQKCPDVLTPDLWVREDTGYDGQYYYYMALDPFIKTDIHYCTDGGAYRYQRVLLPLLASVLSGGNNKYIPHAIVGINLLSILCGVFILSKFCEHFRVNERLSLFYAGSTGLLFSLLRSTVEPFYLSLFLAGLYFYIVKNKPALSVFVFALAVLAKEVALLGVMGIGIYEVGKMIKEKKLHFRPLLFAFPFLAYFLWQFYIYSHFGKFSFNVGMDGSFRTVNSILGFFQRIYFVFSSLDAFSLKQLIEPVLIVNILLLLVLIVLNLPYTPSKLQNPFQVIAPLYAFGLLSVGFYPARTLDVWGYGRHSIEIFLCALFFYILQRKKIFLIPVILNAVTFFMFLAQKSR